MLARQYEGGRHSADFRLPVAARIAVTFFFKSLSIDLPLAIVLLKEVRVIDLEIVKDCVAFSRAASKYESSSD
ncbi:MAG: hypothetical protein BGP05_10180 [Rhizobiales bacterium 62-47]|nr:MAG: hypothetical protein BGP05_10180 [Rhizobiales bacterium 62-47]